MEPAVKRIKRGHVSNDRNMHIVLEWVHDVYKRWKLVSQLSVTEWIILQLLNNQWTELQVNAAAIMLIVAKFVGDPLPVYKLVDWSDGAYTRVQLLEAERDIIRRLIRAEMIQGLVDRCYDVDIYSSDEDADDSGIVA